MEIWDSEGALPCTLCIMGYSKDTTLQGDLLWVKPHTGILEQARAPDSCIFCSFWEKREESQLLPLFIELAHSCLLCPIGRWERCAVGTSLCLGELEGIGGFRPGPGCLRTEYSAST